MMTIRKAADRGHLNFGWLDAKYTFSFASYFDPAHMGFRSLRVMNNDQISEGMGFDTHPHKDMEIITFIIEGELEHRDTMGNHAIIKPGEIQIMSAGKGVHHSEYNPNSKKKTKLYQIWIVPEVKGVEPRYEQYSYLERLSDNKFIDLITPDGGDQVAKIYQQATLKLGRFLKDKQLDIGLNPKSGYWIQVISGKLKANESEIEQEDGIQIENIEKLKLDFQEDSEILFFELA